jgi:hypothetical protein
MLSILIVLTLTAPGSTDESENDTAANTPADAETFILFDAPLITDTGTIYTVDDLVTAGYKKSKELDVEALPN